MSKKLGKGWIIVKILLGCLGIGLLCLWLLILWLVREVVFELLIAALLLPIVVFIGLTESWKPEAQAPWDAIGFGVIGWLLIFLSVGVVIGALVLPIWIWEKLMEKYETR